MNLQVYKVKNNLQKFSGQELHLLAKYFDIPITDKDDLLWLLAIAIVSSRRAEMPPKESKDFNEYFSEIMILGKGASGIVILANVIKEYNSIKPKTLVAIKLLSTDDEKLIYDAHREVQVLQNLSYVAEKCNVGIVCYYGSGVFRKDGIQYFAIITEYIKGVTLKEFIEEEVPHTMQISTGKSKYNLVEEFSNESVIQLMKGLAESLKYIHERNVVHRDIKLANIMVPIAGGICKYIDFGISCFTDKSKFACRKNLAGTRRYISPELWIVYTETEDWKTMSLEQMMEVYKRGDVWALGIVFYVLLFGNFPPELKTLQSIKSFIHNDQKITFGTNFRGDPRLIEIARGMLLKDIRQSTISQVADKLNEI